MSDVGSNDPYKIVGRSQTVGLVLAALCVLLGLAIFASWLQSTPADFFRALGSAPTQPNTALGLTFVSLALLGMITKRFLLATRIAAGLTGLLAFASLVQYAGIDFGIDQLFSQPGLQNRTLVPGRMSPLTALVLLSLGTTVLATSWYPRRRHLTHTVVGAILITLATSSIGSWILGLSPLLAPGVFGLTGVLTAMGFALCGGAMIASAYPFFQKTESIRRQFLLGLTVLGSLICSMLAWQVAATVQFDAEQRETNLETQAIGQIITGAIQRRADGIERMAERWGYAGPEEEMRWRQDARALVRDYEGLVSVEQASAEGIIEWIEPIRGNSQAIGKSVYGFPAAAEAFLRAQKTGRTSYSRIFTLLTRKQGFVIVTPIFTETVLDGYIFTVVELPAFTETLIENVELHGFSVALRGPAGGTYWFGPPPSSTAPRGRYELGLGAGGWEVRVTHPEGSEEGLQTWFPLAILLMGLAATALVFRTGRLSGIAAERRREAEEALADARQDARARREAEQTLAIALESLREGFVLYDKDDRLKLFNARYAEFYNKSMSAIVIGNTFEEIIRHGVKNG